MADLRDALIDRLTCIEIRVPTTGPMAGRIVAEDMADALLPVFAAERDRAIAAELRRPADRMLPGYRATYVVKSLLARANELDQEVSPDA